MCVPQRFIAVFPGVVYNYDQEGVHRAASGWEQCISIPLVQPDMSELLQQWDDLLEEFSLEEAWLPHRCVDDSPGCVWDEQLGWFLSDPTRFGGHSEPHIPDSPRTTLSLPWLDRVL